MRIIFVCLIFALAMLSEKISTTKISRFTVDNKLLYCCIINININFAGYVANVTVSTCLFRYIVTVVLSDCWNDTPTMSNIITSL